MSANEKRELILAHAAARDPQDPLQRASLWAGITVAVIVIAGGWWMTVGREIKDAVSNGSELRKMTEQLNEFADAVDANPLIKSALPGPTAEAAAAGELDADLSGGSEPRLMRLRVRRAAKPISWRRKRRAPEHQRCRRIPRLCRWTLEQRIESG